MAERNVVIVNLYSAFMWSHPKRAQNAMLYKIYSNAVQDMDISCNGMLIRNSYVMYQRWHCRWPWMTFESHFSCRNHLSTNTSVTYYAPTSVWRGNPSTGSSVLSHCREIGVILTPRILWCILSVLSGVLNANGKIYAINRLNQKLVVRPFQPINDCTIISS